MEEVKNFDISEIDGCEFAKGSIGKFLISYHHDFEGMYTGKIQVVYPDSSSGVLDSEKAQTKLDSGEWKVFR